MRIRFAVIAAVAAVAATGAVAVPTASADYGNTTQYQAAISLNCDNKTQSFCTDVVGLGGLWEWFAFGNDGTFDATETFCVHNDPIEGSGAFHANADGIWTHAPASGEAPFGAAEDFWVSEDNGASWEDTLVPYAADTSMHYSFKMGPGVSAEAQVAYIPDR